MSVEEDPLRILVRAFPEEQEAADLKGILLGMPDVSEDSDFARLLDCPRDIESL